MHRKLLVAAALLACAAGCGLQVRGGGSDDGEVIAPDDESSSETTKKPSKKSPPSGSGTGTAPAPLPEMPASESPAPPAQSDDVPSAPVPPSNPVEPLTALSPFHKDGMLTYQRPIIWTIGAFEASTVIHYTTDGSSPTMTSNAATGKIALTNLAEGTRIRWIAGTSTIVHEFVVHVKNDLREETHHIVENVRWNGSNSPVIKTKPNALLTGAARAAVWNGENSCPSCIDQITVGITKASACLVSTNPYVFPGVAGDVTFQIRAPQTPGIYKVKTGWDQQYNCDDAIGHDLRDTEVATIVVEP